MELSGVLPVVGGTALALPNCEINAALREANLDGFGFVDFGLGHQIGLDL